MSWVFIFIAFFVSLFLLMSLGMPVAFCFLLVNIVSMWIIVGFDAGISTLVTASYDAVAHFVLGPIPLFVLMGEILFRTGCITQALDALEKFLGRLPGRLSLLSIVGGTVFAATSGSTAANASVLGSVLVPDMLRRRYAKTMVVGPILGSGSLAMIIPPSGAAVLLGGVAQISVGDLLLGGAVPGLIMALTFFLYVLLRCWMNSELAPIGEDYVPIPLRERLVGVIRYVLPLMIIACMVLGSILLGFATPTESAAIGVLGSIIIALLYGKLTLLNLYQAFYHSVVVAGSILVIIAFAIGFAQALSLTGTARGIILSLSQVDVSPAVMVLVMLGIILVLGMFLELIATMMICMPLFMPIVIYMEIDPVWFGLMALICLDIGTLTPPFGMLLFIMKSVTPPEISYWDIVRSAQPFIVIELAIVMLIFFWPEVVLYLPSITR